MNINDNFHSLSVGDLKEALKELPNDMKIVGVDGHSGQVDNVRFYDESEVECPGPSKEGETVMVVMLG
jgi:hypothetical protein